jgi:hypothetical protein
LVGDALVDGAADELAVVEAEELGCVEGVVLAFLDPLDPHPLTAISTERAPAEQARVLAMCTFSP